MSVATTSRTVRAVAEEFIDLEQELRKRITRDFNPHHVQYFKTDYSRIKSTLRDFEYANFSANHTPKRIASATYHNATDERSSATYSDSGSSDYRFQWSVTRGMRFSTSMSFGVGLPVLADAKVNLSFDLSMNTTETQSKSDKQNWGWTVNQPIPPRSRVELSILVKEAIYSPPFSARVRLSGRGTWSWSVIEKGRIASYSVSRALGEVFTEQPHPDVIVQDPYTIECSISGVFSGVQGIEIDAKADAVPLDAG